MLLNTYLTFNGNCREAFAFYRSVFGGEYLVFQTFSNAPAEMDVPDNLKEQIMHVSLPVGSSMLMGSDYLAMGDNDEQPLPAATVGNNFSISITPDSRDACDTLFNNISAGGKVTMPLADAFWGSYFGSCRDKFDINWMFNFGPENK